MKALGFLLLPAAAFVVPAFGSDSNLPEDAVAIPDSVPRWSVTAGAAVRSSISTNFSMAQPAPLNWAAFVHQQGNSGRDPGLFLGGTGTVHYADGQVGPDYNLLYASQLTPPPNGPGGDAVGIINGPSQVTPNVRQDQAFGDPIATINYYGSQTFNEYSSQARLHGYDPTSSDAGVGPSINLAYALVSSAQDSFSVMAGWSYVQASPGSGVHALGIQTVTQHQTQLNHTYTYDYDQASGTAASPGATFPFDGVSNINTAGYIIYNPALYSGVPGGDGFLPPRESTTSKSTSRTVATFVPVASSNLRVTLNEVDLAAQYERTILPWLHAGISGGPTLNVLDSDFNTNLDWYMNGRGAPVASSQWHDNNSSFKVGLMGQLNVEVDITKRLFLEAHGSYRWVDAVGVSNGPASAKVNASSWEGGLGLGLRF